ncbi:ATP-binding cassette domain-containing protein [Enterococcus casseliflavus]|nr:ATP-binding cassette domain-containing protein [Enterococcus casseliflavus]
MYIIETKSLNKDFDINGIDVEQVLEDVNIEIEKGSLTTIYGPSGCGKSTLLNIISGLDRDYKGAVFFDAIPIKYMTEIEITNFRKKNIGFIFQNFNLIPHLSVLDNVLLGMHLNKCNQSDNIAKARSLLKEVHLEEFENKNVTKLSGGQKQRVAIARALANDPELIIADEPTGSLDSKSEKIILDSLKKLTNKGKTVIIVTHSKSVSSYADNIITMKDGRVEYTKKIHDNLEPKIDVVEEKQLNDRSKNLTMGGALRLAIANFMQRKLRNSMISFATAIGLIGILISFGLGRGIITLIEEDFDNGGIPSQIQITLNQATGSTAVLNKDDEQFIRQLVGEENIKYLESPFGVTMTAATISGLGKISFSETMPNYAQIISLFSEPSIEVGANNSEIVLYGDLYTNPKETGLTVSTTMLDDFIEKSGQDLDYGSFLGKEIVVEIVEGTNEGNILGEFTTTIVRILQDQVEDNNSFMAASELEGIIQNNQFNKIISYMIIQPKDKEQTRTFVNEINATNRYVGLSQESMLELIITFIKIIQGLLIVMSLQAIIVSTVMIGVIIYINIIERTKEIGVMKAVGYQNKDIKAIFNYEAILITILAFIFAVVVSFGIGTLSNLIVRHEFPNITQVFELHFLAVLLSGILAVLIGFLSAVIPVLKISKLDAAESLRYE